MPARFSVGSQFRFRARMCPVVRTKRGSRVYKPGAEVDVFLSAAARCGPAARLDRNGIYVAWLHEQFARLGGARCSDIHVTSFRRAKLLRRDRQRHGVTIERPDVLFEGILAVTHAEEFQQLLRRGIGRHRDFGFGMLLLQERA